MMLLQLVNYSLQGTINKALLQTITKTYEQEIKMLARLK